MQLQLLVCFVIFSMVFISSIPCKVYSPIQLTIVDLPEVFILNLFPYS